MNVGPITFTYTGRLDTGQGVDLLLSAFALHHCARPQDRLLLVGGDAEAITSYRAKRDDFGLINVVVFVDPSHSTEPRLACDETDVFVSPLPSGSHAPKTLFTYLNSGRPVLATDIPAHAALLNVDVALLTKPEPADLARGMLILSEQPELRERLGRAGRALVSEKYSNEAFQKSLDEIYGYVEQSMRQARRL